MPAVTALLGYFPGRALRLGDDLPRGVAMQWARRRAPFVRRGPHLPQDRMARLVERSASRVVRLQTGQVRTYLAWSLATLLVLLWIIS